LSPSALLPLYQVELAFNDIVTDSPFKTYSMAEIKLSLRNIAEFDARENSNVEGIYFYQVIIMLSYFSKHENPPAIEKNQF
jgi:hypothetical protein